MTKLLVNSSIEKYFIYLQTIKMPEYEYIKSNISRKD